MTPFQRQVIAAARQKEHEAQQEQMPDMDGQQPQSPSRPKNARAGSTSTPSAGPTGSRSETIRYVNRDEYPDHPAHDE